MIDESSGSGMDPDDRTPPPWDEPAPQADAFETRRRRGARHAPAETPEEKQSVFRWLIETVVMVGLAFVLAMGIKTYIAQPFVIPTGSMQSTLEIGDRVFYNKFIYFFQEPGPGDIVVLDNPDAAGPTLTKRVIAIGGQTIDIREGVVYVDDVEVEEAFVEDHRRDEYSLIEPIRVPEGFVWLMGDNRRNSGDSRIFGPQPVENIHGKAFMIYWPLDRFQLLKDD